MRRSTRRKSRNTGAEDLNVAPLMNLFVAIVPMLLMSAVFVSLAGIELSLPQASAAPQQAADFMLALRITESGWQVDARGEASVRLEKGDGNGLLQALEALHAAHPEHSSVLVACTETVPYAEVVQVLDLAALAGFPDCALAGVGALDASSNSGSGS